MDIRKGSEFSNYETRGITIGKSKKQNRDGVLSNFVIFTVGDVEGGNPTRVFKFEEQLFPGACKILNKYCMMENGQKMTDAKGGFIIDLQALKDSEDAALFKNQLFWAGGMVEEYQLKKGPCYANDVNGNRVKDKQGQDVIKDTIKVFVQVKMFMGDKTIYFDGMGLNENGDRLERQFYRQAVNPTASAVTTQPAPEGQPAEPQDGSDPW